MATGIAADAQGLELYLLDMGLEKYGDAIVCRRGSQTILIDGGHLGDLHDRGEFLSIPNQLAQIFGHDPPFPISLLVVTHCHNDHIGCLPEMVLQNIIRPEWALVADENLGFGIPTDGDSVLDAADVTPAMQRVIAALREEDHSELPADALRQFLDDSAKLVDRYTDMLSALGDRIGSRLVRYGVDDPGELSAHFAEFGLRILGPTTEHLLICAEAIRQAVDDLVEDLREVVADGQFGDAAGLDELAAYRALASEQFSEIADAGRPGFALNDQSIVLQIKQGATNVLLSGDMQFADPNLDELEPFITELRDQIAAAAPFDLVKIAHHASHNAFDEDVLQEMGSTPRYVISGGIQDSKHPDKGVLNLLKRERARSGIEWARTDKNGLITATFGGQGGLAISRGRRNSSRPNVFDMRVPAAGPIVALAPAPAPLAAAPQSAVTATTSAESGETMVETERVRVTADVPHLTTQVTITINVQPGGAVSGGVPKADVKELSTAPRLRLGGGRSLPPLLFITSGEALRRNIGKEPAEQVLQAIRDARQALLESLPAGATDPHQVLSAVRGAIQAAGDVRGVVIVGGYDVVPASRLNTIDQDLRRAIERAEDQDGQIRDVDQFIVWSDAIYGDRDGDGMAELPVSRVPDGHSPELVYRTLQAGAAPPIRRAGIRNLARPFASKVFAAIHFPQHERILISEPTQPNSPDLSHGHLQDAAIYLMLHGHYLNTTSFAGERSNRSSFTAIHVQNVMQNRLDKAVVLAGCCWGALTVRERAVDGGPSDAVTPLSPQQSMALSFLNSGALAFVGCTGVHYSPAGSEPSYNGGPMHVAFWRHYAQGLAPAEALFRAKTDYLAGIPHDPTADAFDRAVELKLLREFTCLGLGW